MRPMRRHSTISVPMPRMSMPAPAGPPATLPVLILAERRPRCTIDSRRDLAHAARPGARHNPGKGFPGATPRPLRRTAFMADADSDLLADLTPAQREAVTHFEGPLLIL